MLTRIELTNFMSHKHTVIQPAAGVTVLVGPNNVGKSAVVAALQILCHNDTSTYVMRHGERECSVEVHTDDGHVVQWRRKNSPSYVIDGVKFDRLRGSGLPEELHQALKLAKVDAAGDVDFDIHFGMQKSPIFLLDGSAATAARFFASSSDAIRLMAMQKRHKEKHAHAKREKIRLDAESAQLNAELEILNPIVELNERIDSAKRAHESLQRVEQSLAAMQTHLSQLQQKSAQQQRVAADVETLRALKSPPKIHDEAALSRVAQEITKQERNVLRCAAENRLLRQLAHPPALADELSLRSLSEHLAAASRALDLAICRAAALATVPNPPTLSDEAELRCMLNALESTQARKRRWGEALAALGRTSAAPAPHDTTDLTAHLQRLQTAAEQTAKCEAKLKSTQEQLDAAAAELRAAAGGTACPICGRELDADRVIERAAAGLGAHEHE